MKLRYLLLVALVAAAVMSELADGAKGKGKGKGRRRKKGVRRRLILNDENWSTKAIPESVCKVCGFANPKGTKKTKGRMRIVGGVTAARNEFPWMVVIAQRNFAGSGPAINEKSTICGSSLISAKWILTAAHCFYDPVTPKMMVEVPLEDYVYVASAHNLNRLGELPKAEVFEAKQYMVHPSYKRKKSVLFGYDVALVELKRKIKKWTKSIRPLCLSGEYSDFGGEVLEYAGWGHLKHASKEEVGNFSEILQKVAVKGVAKKECIKDMVGVDAKIKRHHVCTYEEGKDACQGDSGGPLIKKMRMRRYRLAGLVSFGVECGRDRPGIVVNPADPVIKKWIVQHTKGSPPCFK